MARLLSHLRRSLSASSPPCLSLTRRLRSTFSGKTPQIIELHISSSSSSPDEAAMLKKLDDCVQNLMVQKATPDWLPFIPGASFWVPPRSGRRDGGSGVTFADLLANLVDNLPEDDGDDDQLRRSLPGLSGSESEQEEAFDESAEVELETEGEALSDSNDLYSSDNSSESEQEEAFEESAEMELEIEGEALSDSNDLYSSDNSEG